MFEQVQELVANVLSTPVPTVIAVWVEHLKVQIELTPARIMPRKAIDLFFDVVIEATGQARAIAPLWVICKTEASVCPVEWRTLRTGLMSRIEPWRNHRDVRN